MLKKPLYPWLWAPFCLALLANCATAAPASGPEEEPTNLEIVSMEGMNLLSIDYGNEDVYILESPDKNLVLKEYLYRDNPRFFGRIRRRGRELEVRRGSRAWAFFWEKSRIEIAIPRAYRGDLSIELSSGNLKIQRDLESDGRIRLALSSGNMTTQNIRARNLIAKASSGDLAMGAIRGNAEVEASSGSLSVSRLAGPRNAITVSSGGINLEEAAGETSVTMSTGNLQIGKVTGTLKAELSSGRVRIREFRGQGGFTLSSGDVELGLAELTGDLRFHLSSGDVALRLLENVPFNLDAETSTGSVNVNLPEGSVSMDGGAVVKPFGHNPRYAIEARFTSGKVTITR